MNEKQVLVTGASGFIALHCIHQLLEQGYTVRGSLRSLTRENEVRATLKEMGSPVEKLSFVEADLLDDAGWPAAVKSCDYVLHVASPFPLGEPAHEDDLIIPAREGALRVLKAASDAGVKRVVLTSSVAAVISGLNENRIYTENDWSDLNADIGAYAKSKTLAERAAWQFMKSIAPTSKMELATINPGLVLGPLPDKTPRSSAEIIHQLMKNKVPGLARMYFNYVDVRDVAAAHILAMTNPQAAGKRFICTAEGGWISSIAIFLKKNFASRGYTIKTFIFPSFLVRLLGNFDKTIALTVPMLDKKGEVSNAQTVKVLGWQPRGLEEMTVAMAESLIKLELV